jgi:hypothetical protein
VRGQPGTRHPGLILVGCCLAFFVVSLDATIVNVALPTMQAELDASVSGLQWIIDSYTAGVRARARAPAERPVPVPAPRGAQPVPVPAPRAAEPVSVPAPRLPQTYRYPPPSRTWLGSRRR